MSPLSEPARRPTVPECLRECPLFRSLSAGELERLAARFAEVTLDDGDAVFAAGDPADALYVVLRGTVTLYDDARRVKSARALARLRRGDFFGEMGLFENGRRGVAARATGSGAVLRIGREDLYAFLESYPVIALKLEMAAARGHSTKVAAALASAERRIARTRVNQDVVLKTAAGVSSRMRLIDMSIAGLCLAEAPADWKPEKWVDFHVAWGPRVLRFYGRVAWRSDETVGIELMDRTPDRDEWIERVLGQMVDPLHRSRAPVSPSFDTARA